MRRPFVRIGCVWRLLLGQPLLKQLDASPQLVDLPLLPEKFLAEVGEGLVLQGRKGFELDDPCFHAADSSRPPANV